MTYPIRSIASLGVLLLAITGCDKEESLGEYTDSATDSMTSTSGATPDPTEGTSASTDDGTDTVPGTDTGTGTGTEPGTEGSEDTGTSFCGPGSCMQYEYDCSGGACGGLSRFDDDGCVRPSCSDDTGCAAGERCYRATDFGACESSDVFCEDDEATMSCACGSTDDCGGAFCVPEDVYPVPDAGPTDSAIATDDCAPDDGPATSFRFGLASSVCDDPADPPDATVYIRLDYYDQTPGTYDFGEFEATGQGTFDAGDGVLVQAVAGSVTVDAWDMVTGVTGSYDIVLEDGTYLAGDFVEIPYCPADVLCG